MAIGVAVGTPVFAALVMTLRGRGNEMPRHRGNSAASGGGVAAPFHLAACSSPTTPTEALIHEWQTAIGKRSSISVREDGSKFSDWPVVDKELPEYCVNRGRVA